MMGGDKVYVRLRLLGWMLVMAKMVRMARRRMRMVSDAMDELKRRKGRSKFHQAVSFGLDTVARSEAKRSVRREPSRTKGDTERVGCVGRQKNALSVVSTRGRKELVNSPSGKREMDRRWTQLFGGSNRT